MTFQEYYTFREIAPAAGTPGDPTKKLALLQKAKQDVDKVLATPGGAGKDAANDQLKQTQAQIADDEAKQTQMKINTDIQQTMDKMKNPGA